MLQRILALQKARERILEIRTERQAQQGHQQAISSEERAIYERKLRRINEKATTWSETKEVARIAEEYVEQQSESATIAYNIGDWVLQFPFGFAQCQRWVKVTGKTQDVKHGRSGFDGVTIDGLTVWGYGSDIREVHAQIPPFAQKEGN